MSRFQLIQSFTALPGSCVICGSSTGPAIDTSLSIDYFGAVVFCIPCAKDFGRASGLVDPAPPVEESPVAESVTREEFNELCETISATLARIDSANDRINSHVCVVEDSAGETSEPVVSDSGAVSTTEQDDNSIVRKKSARVSSSASNGPVKFDLA